MSEPNQQQTDLDGEGRSDRSPGASSQRANISRRGFIGGASAGAGFTVLGGTQGSAAAQTLRGDHDGGSTGGPDRFGRMFGGLAPFAEPSEELREALVALGAPGGPLDAGDPIDVGPVRLITEPALSPNNRDNPTQTAGTTFLGQFLDHDITRDAGSPLGRPQNLARSSNLRTAAFDLDSVYGGGPAESPELFRRNGLQFRVESGGSFEDVPRDGSGSAIIADPRNDENLMVSGLQAAFLLFHNGVVDRLGRSRRGRRFEEARRLVRWHWQWIIVHEYLPQIVDPAILRSINRRGPRFFDPRRPRIPVEFQGAAFRFGHTQVRPSYRANLAGDNGEPFFAFVFDPDSFGQSDPDSLVGGHRSPRRFVGWQTFFDFGDGEVKPNKRIDTKLSSILFQLPTFAIDSARGSDAGPLSLATRNLLRHITWQLPSGQAVAKAMGVDRLAARDLSDLEPFGANLVASTPLWFYILREAEIVEDGLRLGPVGGRIVAEVFMTLLRRDDSSFLGADPNWRPTLEGATRGDFVMTDLLTIAGVDPASRGQ